MKPFIYFLLGILASINFAFAQKTDYSIEVSVNDIKINDETRQILIKYAIANQPKQYQFNLQRVEIKIDYNGRVVAKSISGDMNVLSPQTNYTLTWDFTKDVESLGTIMGATLYFSYTDDTRNKVESEQRKKENQEEKMREENARNDTRNARLNRQATDDYVHNPQSYTKKAYHYYVGKSWHFAFTVGPSYTKDIMYEKVKTYEYDHITPQYSSSTNDTFNITEPYASSIVNYLGPQIGLEYSPLFSKNCIITSYFNGTLGFPLDNYKSSDLSAEFGPKYYNKTKGVFLQSEVGLKIAIGGQKVRLITDISTKFYTPKATKSTRISHEDENSSYYISVKDLYSSFENYRSTKALIGLRFGNAEESFFDILGGITTLPPSSNQYLMPTTKILVTAPSGFRINFEMGFSDKSTYTPYRYERYNSSYSGYSNSMEGKHSPIPYINVGILLSIDRFGQPWRAK